MVDIHPEIHLAKWLDLAKESERGMPLKRIEIFVDKSLWRGLRFWLVNAKQIGNRSTKSLFPLSKYLKT